MTSFILSGVKDPYPEDNARSTGKKRPLRQVADCKFKITHYKLRIRQMPDAPQPVANTPASTEPRRSCPQAERIPFRRHGGRRSTTGPLDLLLDLIRKQDIDIYDIPIAQITAQYLTYVERIRELDVDVAAEFIYMASVLIQIKSRMLLPRDPTDPAEQEDPRAELVNRLLEHERFKTAAQMLLQKQQIEDAVWSNPALKEFKDAEGTEPEMAADVVDLVRTFQQILDRARSRPIIEVDEEGVTVTQMIDYFRRRLVAGRPAHPVEAAAAQPANAEGAGVRASWRSWNWCGCRPSCCDRRRVFGEIMIKKALCLTTSWRSKPAVRDDWR